MRTEAQVKLCAQNYGLNRQRLSILLHKRKDIRDQTHLRELAFDLKRAGDGLVHRLLGTLAFANSKEHIKLGNGVQSSWGALFLMAGDER